MNQKSFAEKRKLFFLMLPFFFLLVLPIATAQPPPETQTNVNIEVGLQVEFTQVPVFENGRDHLFTAHVFNISTGLRVDNTTTNCTFHLFDNKGNHQIEQVPMVFDIVGIDWDYNVTRGNFTRNGDYSHLTVCNSTTIGGFLASGFEVTQTGVGNLTQFYWIILVISATILVLGFWIKDPWIVIFGTFGLYFVGLYILINGIVGVKDMITTWAIGLIIIAIAAYISIKTAGETIYG